MHVQQSCAAELCFGQSRCHLRRLPGPCDASDVGVLLLSFAAQCRCCVTNDVLSIVGLFDIGRHAGLNQAPGLNQGLKPLSV